MIDFDVFSRFCFFFMLCMVGAAWLHMIVHFRDEERISTKQVCGATAGSAAVALLIVLLS